MSVFFIINEITARDAGPDIIKSHLFSYVAKIITEEFRVRLVTEDRDYCYRKTFILRNVF